MKNKGEKKPLKTVVKNFFSGVKSMWKTPPKDRFLTLKEICNFGVYALGVSFVVSAINYVATITYIPYFYRIEQYHAYIIFIIATFINMCIIPYIGNKIEKTKTKWGRYKPYIILTLPLYAILTALVVWIPQYQDYNARLIYAYLTCVPLLITNGFLYNMYQTMPTIITPHAQERTDIMTPIGLVFGFAPTVFNIVAGPVRQHFMEIGQEYMGIRIMGIVAVVLGILCMLCILRVKERVYSIKEEEENTEKIKIKDALKLLSKNKPLIILCIALVLGSLREFTAQFRMLMIQCRFAPDVGTAIGVSGIPQTVIGFASTVAMLLLPIVTRKMDKKNILILFTATAAITNLILGLVGHATIPIGTASAVGITILHFIMCISPTYLLIPVMLGELADYQQYKTGKRLDIHLQNMLFIVPGLATQVFMLITYFWQKSIGFEPMNYTLPEGLAEGEKFIVSPEAQAIACEWFDAVAIISAVSGILMVIVLLFYPLSRKKHKEVVEALKARSTITNVSTAELAADGFIVAEEELLEEQLEQNKVVDATTEEIKSDVFDEATRESECTTNSEDEGNNTKDVLPDNEVEKDASSVDKTE